MLNYIWASYLAMAPYLLFGFLLAGVLHVLIKKELVLKHLGKHNALSVIKAALLGVPLPLCSCSVIPTAVALRKQGASTSAVMAFLISTPMTGLDSIMATYGIMGIFIAIYRAVIALLMGLLGGLLILAVHPERESGNFPVIQEATSCCSNEATPSCGCTTENITENESSCSSMSEPSDCGCKTDDSSEDCCSGKSHSSHDKHWIRRILEYSFDELLGDIAKPLVIGILLSGLLAWLIPEDLFARLELPKVLQMGLMVVVGIPLYICATSSLPMGAVLILKGLSPGVVFVFLAAGPATNAATMTTITSTFGKKFFALYLAAIISGAVAAGFLLDSLIAHWSINIPINSLMHHEDGIWLAYSSAALLGFFLLRIFVKQLKRRFSK